MACTATDISIDTSLASSTGGAPKPRKPWSTPQVIVSELRNAGAQVAVGSDGTDTRFSYQYGS